MFKIGSFNYVDRKLRAFLPPELKSWLKGFSPQRTDRVERLYASPAGKRAIQEKFKHDPFLLNYHLNMWEYSTGQVHLESYPWRITIPIAATCNAKCSFCNAWLHQTTSALHPEQVSHLAPLLKYAKLVGLVSFGETLTNPFLEEIISACRSHMDPRATFFIVTNGLLLSAKLETLVRNGVLGYSISLNAATDQTHQTVMGAGKRSFSRILEAINRLVQLRNSTHPHIHVGVGFVLCRDNLHEAADFVRLGNEIGVDRIDVRTLLPKSSLEPFLGLNYHLLPPYLHPDFQRLTRELREAIERSKVYVEYDPESWGDPVIPEDVVKRFRAAPPRVFSRKEALRDPQVFSAYRAFAEADAAVANGRGRGEKLLEMTEYEQQLFQEQVSYDENPRQRYPHFKCGYPYHYFLIQELSFRANPCCYYYNVPGHEKLVYDGSLDFLELWNSPAYLDLRRRLKEGPMLKMCKLCQNQGR